MKESVCHGWEAVEKKVDKEFYQWSHSFALAWPNHRWASFFLILWAGHISGWSAAFHQSLLIIQGVEIPHCRGQNNGNFTLGEMALLFLLIRNKRGAKTHSWKSWISIQFCVGCQTNTHWPKQAPWFHPKYWSNCNPIFSPWETKCR